MAIEKGPDTLCFQPCRALESAIMEGSQHLDFLPPCGPYFVLGGLFRYQKLGLMFSIEVGPQMPSASIAQEPSWSSAVFGAFAA